MDSVAGSENAKSSSRRRRPMTTYESQIKPREVRPAAISRPTESDKAIRDRVKRGLPRARRLVIRNRIDLAFPPDFQSTSTNPNTSALHKDDALQESDHLPMMEYNVSMVPTQDTSNSQLPLVQLQHAWNPATILGAGRVDPFTRFPIKMSARERWLLDEMNTGRDLRMKTYRENWLPTAIQDSASFHQFLANIALLIFKERRRNAEKIVATFHHSIALMAVNNMLADPAKRASDAVITSIVTFMCYSTSINDNNSYQAHMSGLEKVIELRGGWKSFDRNPTLRCMVYGVDMCGACRRDTRPRFPLPTHLIRATQYAALLETSLPSYHQQTSILQRLAIRDANLQQAIKNTLIALSYIKQKVLRNESWIQVRIVVFWIEPIVHTLAGNCIADLCSSNASNLVEEVIRLGLMLFLCMIRRVCGQLGVETRILVMKLKKLFEMKGSDMDWNCLGEANEVKKAMLWCLYLGMLESQGTPEETWFHRMVGKERYNVELESSEFLSAIKAVLWIDEVFEHCGSHLEETVA